MAKSIVVLAALATSVIAGCATLPEYREAPVSTADVILNIKCELRDAAWLNPANAWVRDWNASLVVSLIIDHDGGVDAETGFVFPLNHGATFVLALTGGATGKANRTERIEFKENLAKLHNRSDILCAKENPDRYARLGGRLGIEDLLARVGHAKELAKIDPKTLNYNIDFVVRRGATATPRFNLVPIGPEKTFSGNLKWSGSRTDTHTLRITLQPREQQTCSVRDKDGKCATAVYIVGAPIFPIAPLDKDSRWLKGHIPSPGKNVPARRPSITPSEADRLDAGQGRNVLESINDQLRQQGLGN